MDERVVPSLAAAVAGKLESTAAASSEDQAPRLLRFYDRLRRRIQQAAERRGQRLGAATTEALLLVPDVFMLLLRLSLDRQVPQPSRAMIGGALAYFLLPADLLPELTLGAAGYVEDLVLAAVVLAEAFSRDLEPYAERHWSGRKRLRVVLGDLLTTGEALLGADLFARLQRLLARRGLAAARPPG